MYDNEQKSMIKRSKQLGFTAVELLITLFIAAAFLMSGYQLYNVVIKDGGEIRTRTNANNVAYQYLQQYKSDSNYIKATCSATTQNPLTNAQLSNLSNVTLTVTISCPYPSTPSVSKVSVNIKYNNPQQEITNATYVSP